MKPQARMNRRQVLLIAGSAACLPRAGLAAETRMRVFKSPTCGCCSAWIDHLEQAGLSIDAVDVAQEDLWALKTGAGITPELGSCHTGFIDGYVIEGHVPVADILRLVSERPDAVGLTVPGMPIGSPGMEVGDTREPYTTLLIGRDGTTTLFARHG